MPNLALIPLTLTLMCSASHSKQARFGCCSLLELGVTGFHILPFLVQLRLTQLASQMVWQVGWVFRLLLVIVLAMIATDGPAEHFGSVEVVHCEHGASLVL